ncbi:Mif2/CENP-C cupin domain-containing protein [Plasmodiophora brassicae]|uniref:Mif2/CENP-C cupin domain-containing protein n=1 Tax=Plasmodiophora brassicae TaxID=37360 RepID=A0A0G4J7I8_PLABS|nr:hypothetical protein PBRA_009435 [Plasmodiophora brassicae]SPQ93142.1 unnamed protein product [Plasmodiophora brassicae]
MPRLAGEAGPVVSRRDRPENKALKRVGTGREPTQRLFSLTGRHTGLKLPMNTTKDVHGFDDVTKTWPADDDDDEENVAPVTGPRRLSALFPASPASTALTSQDPPSPIVKRLSFERPVDSPPLHNDSPFDDDYDDHAPADDDDNEESAPASPILAPSPVKPPPRRRSSLAPTSAKPSKETSSVAAVKRKSPPTASSCGSSVAKKKSTDASTRKRKRSRRATLALVDEAKRTGLVTADDDHDDDGPRRSGRTRVNPLKYYEGETLNYVRGPHGLPTVDKSCAVIKFAPTPPHKPPVKRRAPKRSRTMKRTSGSRADDEESDEEAMVALRGESWILDARGKERKRHVAARASDHEMIRMQMTVPTGVKPQRAELVPTACKLFDYDGMSAGVIEIPAQGVKYKELSGGPEVFHVTHGERNAIFVTVHTTEFQLSPGDTFCVPARNSYSIRNTSRTKLARLFFTTYT